jgi:hypothetical protein
MRPGTEEPIETEEIGESVVDHCAIVAKGQIAPARRHFFNQNGDCG